MALTKDEAALQAQLDKQPDDAASRMVLADLLEDQPDDPRASAPVARLPPARQALLQLLDARGPQTFSPAGGITLGDDL